MMRVRASKWSEDESMFFNNLLEKADDFTLMTIKDRIVKMLKERDVFEPDDSLLYSGSSELSNTINKEDLLMVYKAGASKFERKILDDYIANGWWVVRSGYPDFMAYKHINGQDFFRGVEVKNRATPLKKNQRVMKKFLTKAGFRFVIERTNV